MGSKLLFRFRSGTHGLNEELGRHGTRNSSKAFFCECECKSISRECFMGILSIVAFVRNLSEIWMVFYRMTFI